MAEVSEQAARRAVDALVRGVTQDQQQAGVIPSATQAQQFAHQVVAEVVAKNERSAAPAPGAAPSKPSELLPPDRISRGEVGLDTQVINRQIGTVEIDPNTRQATGELKPRKRAPEDPRLRARLDFLGKMPDWHVKLMGAAVEGEVYARRMGIMDPHERMSVVADFVINVVDQSNRLWGDWRVPQPPQAPKLIFT